MLRASERFGQTHCPHHPAGNDATMRAASELFFAPLTVRTSTATPKVQAGSERLSLCPAVGTPGRSAHIHVRATGPCRLSQLHGPPLRDAHRLGPVPAGASCSPAAFAGQRGDYLSPLRDSRALFLAARASDPPSDGDTHQDAAAGDPACGG